MMYLTARMPEVFNEKTCFWIVGGEVDRGYMMKMAQMRIQHENSIGV